uniref:Uncharacterized protein n=1 Tax=Candidatus Kentrum sp. TUN TaxID=2126343 RepID=A0A451AUK1_9GAMM|nr:MAG: hypothetical protein BECKTUN1418F_GA0071002_102323 [Candidatus Kentron sp. TUN]VFK69567.1 MAG: hypothetical protein BECKTUN1418E_GA0071001_11992 [Candidatus Kentron sp. TUN]
MDEGSEGTINAMTQWRTSALTEIYQTAGVAGIEDLITACANPPIVGNILAETAWRDDIPWPEWIIAKGEDFTLGTPMTQCISGFLCASYSQASNNLPQKVIALGQQAGWDAVKFARFLVLAKPEPETWQLAKICGPKVHAAYWQNVQPRLFRYQEDPEFVLEHLLEAKRPRTVLGCCAASLDRISPRHIYVALQQFLQGEESDVPQIDSYDLTEMLEHLEKSGEIEKTELIRLEFSLFPALGYGQETHAAALYEGVMSEPALFTELICLCYKPKHGEQEEATEVTQAAAKYAYGVLHACKRLPGTRTDGSIDGETFTQFINKTRQLCRDADRLDVCDSKLGEILAHAPADKDGIWPCTPVRKLLDRPELEEMRLGFNIGTNNKRGVTTRGFLDGGDQERDLAAHYREQAERLHNSYPNVAAMLEEIAKGYECDGKGEDVQASLRKEQF